MKGVIVKNNNLMWTEKERMCNSVKSHYINIFLDILVINIIK
jgi:hypothetical protein